MEALKNKLKQEIKEFGNDESNLNPQKLDVIYKVSKTLYYLCQIEKLENNKLGIDFVKAANLQNKI